MNTVLRPLAPNLVTLRDGIASARAALVRDYLMSLRNDNLLQNYYYEAGMANHSPDDLARIDQMHRGWEYPGCQLRGHFLGHWLSAAARFSANTNDLELEAKLRVIVRELRRCQDANGGEWIAAIPEKYFDMIVAGREIWVPQYGVHKILMGLADTYKYTRNDDALEALVRAAKWFHRWSGKFTREQFDDVLDHETGGMLEVWADLYGITRDPAHLELMERYDRPRLFDRLLAGEDVLTNRHANTTIPEALGAARAWEVTGNPRWKAIVEAYWDCAVTKRGFFCTGGQTSGEIWMPPNEIAARLGEKTQEHCTVYNMMRLADFLLRWSGGDARYADYWERNWYNGILAQQHPGTGMVAYYLPLLSGAQKIWGSRTHHFWCCHGTLVQAHSTHNAAIYYERDEGILIAQRIPSECRWTHGDVAVTITQSEDLQASDLIRVHLGTGRTRRPEEVVTDIHVKCDKPARFALSVRIPWWTSSTPTITIDGEPVALDATPGAFQSITREWSDNTIRMVLPKTLTACPLPDAQDTVAFMDGPVVLAGISDEQVTLYGDVDNPRTILTSEDERHWTVWHPNYITANQPRNIKFMPLHQITNQRYTTYFPVRPNYPTGGGASSARGVTAD